jgi:hypothetical protein
MCQKIAVHIAMALRTSNVSPPPHSPGGKLFEGNITLSVANVSGFKIQPWKFYQEFLYVIMAIKGSITICIIYKRKLISSIKIKKYNFLECQRN